MPEVLSYAKNEWLGFEIPYGIGGKRHAYCLDFLVLFDDGRSRADPLRLVLEISGEKLEENEAKVATARDRWLPAVNNADIWGLWGGFDIRDAWSCQKELRSYVASLRTGAARASAEAGG